MHRCTDASMHMHTDAHAPSHAFLVRARIDAQMRKTREWSKFPTSDTLLAPWTPIFDPITHFSSLGPPNFDLSQTSRPLDPKFRPHHTLLHHTDPSHTSRPLDTLNFHHSYTSRLCEPQISTTTMLVGLAHCGEHLRQEEKGSAHGRSPLNSSMVDDE